MDNYSDPDLHKEQDLVVTAIQRKPAQKYDSDSILNRDSSMQEKYESFVPAPSKIPGLRKKPQ